MFVSEKDFLPDKDNFRFLSCENKLEFWPFHQSYYHRDESKLILMR